MKRLFFLALLAGAFSFPAKVAGQVSIEIMEVKLQSQCCYQIGDQVVLFEAQVTGHQHPNHTSMERIVLANQAGSNSLKNFKNFRLLLNDKILNHKDDISNDFLSLSSAVHIPNLPEIATIKVIADAVDNLETLISKGFISVQDEKSGASITKEFKDLHIRFTESLSTENHDVSKIVMRQNHDDRKIIFENLPAGKQIQVFDMRGIIVREISDAKPSETIEFYDLPRGIYVLMVNQMPYCKIGI